MKFFLFFFQALLLFFSFFSPSLANMEVLETIHDFGIINYNQKTEHLFKIVNRGKEDMFIEKLKSSCGCVAAIVSDKNIKPGEEGIIKVVYDAHKWHAGEFIKTVSVFIAGEKDPVTLSIKGNVKYKFDPATSPAIFITPQQIDLGDINPGDEKKFNILIENRGKGDLFIKNFTAKQKVSLRSPFNSINKDKGIPLNQKAIKPGKKIQATFSYVAKQYGLIDSSFTIVSNDPANPVIFVDIKGKVKAR